MKILSLVIEVVPDLAAGRRLYDIGDLDDEDVLNVMMHRCRQTSPTEQLGPHLLAIAGLAWLGLEEGVPDAGRCIADGPDGELRLLTEFTGRLQGVDRLVVRSAGRPGLDHLRSRVLLHGLRGWDDSGETPLEVVDLSDELGGMPFEEFAILAGFPFPPSPEDALGPIALAEVEAVVQMLSDLRLRRFRGEISASDLTMNYQGLRDALLCSGRSPLEAFAMSWSQRGE